MGNLPFSADEQDIRDHFLESGYILTEIKLMIDRESGRSRGFAFVDLESDEAAAKAVQNLDNQDMMGRSLKVDIAQPAGSGRENKKGKRW